ncbi:MAG: UDP-N-acetylenolpyruvoylglucosamine reductase [Hirschia sp.]|nr:UDP-N-acetylenolpyruvoylglucosamine reductase [Hirschia sp.]MBF19534.1 UDP-N-acetylenolpyruvoylglucosamine reductase [Hirschia sp.]
MSDLISRMPEVRGKLLPDAELAPFTWFRVGGAADVLFLPEDADDLADFLRALPLDIPVTVLGAASNVIVRDGGIEGVVVRLTPAFGKVRVNQSQVIAGSAALDARVSQTAARFGLSGMEFFSGVPGTIGGALRMNAGCYDRETADVLIEATALTRKGQWVTLSNRDFGYSYRHSEAPEEMIFIEAVFQGTPDKPEAVRERIEALKARREEAQPIRDKTGGSTFANPDPPGTPDQRKCWKLIDEAGMRGARRGGAQVSEKHCNFLINTGDATAADIEGLGEDVRAKVKETSGVDLRWEIKRIGRAG